MSISRAAYVSLKLCLLNLVHLSHLYPFFSIQNESIHENNDTKLSLTIPSYCVSRIIILLRNGIKASQGKFDSTFSRDQSFAGKFASNDFYVSREEC
ncbi:15658_t:CDS:2, partial [Acaulospora morrowiae]